MIIIFIQHEDPQLILLVTLRMVTDAKIESSPVWNTFCLAELIYDNINRQFSYGKCPKPGKINQMCKKK